MSALWTSEDAARATGGRCAAAWACTGVSSDSRKVAAGDLFVALEGPRFDGHDFVADALERGAAAALVARRPGGVAEGAPLLEVDDTLAALERLARAARDRSRARVIALTGSVGKTSTKEALRLALSAQAPTFASPASFNNQWGVPLSLAALPRDARYGVFELGMNHPGEIAPLARLVRPHVAVVITVEPVHMAYFDSLAAVADSKAEIFEGMGEGGVAVLNHDNPYHGTLAAAARARGVKEIVYFGVHRRAAVRLVDAALGPESSSVTADVAGRRVAFEVGAPGRHWVIIGLAALAAVHAAGADVQRAAASLADARPLSGRGARHRIGIDGESFTLIDESYNANPVSMRAAIALLDAAEPGVGGRRIAVLGDMLELGDEAPDLHVGLAASLVAARADLVFTVGPHMARLRDALPAAMRAGHAARAEDLVAPVAAAVGTGDVVMVKGSLGTGLAPIVAALKSRDRASAPRAAGNG